MTPNAELEIAKQLFSSLGNDDKKTFLQSIKLKEQISKKLSFTRKLKECPHCKSSHFKKNDTTHEKQRYICNDCKKTFVITNDTILFDPKKDISVWKKYIHCMVEKYSMRKTAKICGMNPTIAFNWRHKILDALQEIQKIVRLSGIAEVCETFMSILSIDHHNKFPYLINEIVTTKRG